MGGRETGLVGADGILADLDSPFRSVPGNHDVFKEGYDHENLPIAEFEERYGVAGVGKTVDADWAEAHPEHLRANDNGHVAPERCLAAHLVNDDDPVHLEVCNASFSDNVTQRLRGAMAREAYGEILDPRGVCLYADGQRDDEAIAKLRGGELAFPTLTEALEMLGLDEDTAAEAADVMRERRAEATGRTVRGDVV